MTSQTKQPETKASLDNPRKQISRLINESNNSKLLEQAGNLHGHYCPGLSMGVIAAQYAMRMFQMNSDGMEDLITILEINSCFADGVQFVTGCTFGNNALIYRDYGKTAFTLAKRSGAGIRISTKPDSYEQIQKAFPKFTEYFEKVITHKDHSEESVNAFKQAGIDASFGMIDLKFDTLFSVDNISIDIPQFAPIHESIICEKCGESVMGSKIVTIHGKHQCIPCSNSSYYQLDGSGINHENNNS